MDYSPDACSFILSRQKVFRESELRNRVTYFVRRSLLLSSGSPAIGRFKCTAISFTMQWLQKEGLILSMIETPLMWTIRPKEVNLNPYDRGGLSHYFLSGSPAVLKTSVPLSGNLYFPMGRLSSWERTILVPSVVERADISPRCKSYRAGMSLDY